MNKIFFSIIIPTLNEKLFLPRLLDSLVDQQDQNFEIIVSDGNSYDGTLDVVKKYQKIFGDRLSIIKNRSAGVSLQRNQGAKASCGHWLLFIDADGIFFPYTISRLKNLIHCDPSMHFSVWFAPDSNKVRDAILMLLGNIAAESGILIKRPVACGQFFGVKKSLFQKVGGFDETIDVGEDIDFSRRIYESGHMLKIYCETLCVASLRRYRKYGIMKIIRINAKTILQILLTNRSSIQFSEYMTGGHFYGKNSLPPLPFLSTKKSKKQSV